MSSTLNKYQLDKIGNPFTGEYISQDYLLDNYKTVDFLVLCGEDEGGAEISVKIYGKDGEDGEKKALGFHAVGENGLPGEHFTEEGTEFSAGGVNCEIYRVNARDLAKCGFDRVHIRLTAVPELYTCGSVVVVSSEPRYSE